MLDDIDMIDDQESVLFSQESFSNFFASSTEEKNLTMKAALTIVNPHCAQQDKLESDSPNLISNRFAMPLDNISPELLTFQNISSVAEGQFDLLVEDITHDQIYFVNDANVCITSGTSGQQQHYTNSVNCVVPSQLIQPTDTSQILASLPASNNWPGLYEFDVCFESLPSSSKKPQWIYSLARNKLYANMNTACPINLSTKIDVPSSTLVRFKALFMQPFHIDDHVHRCLNHKNLDVETGVQYADHVIQCESDLAQYEVERNGSCSVIVPYLRYLDQNFSTYILKFKCFNSCTGGMNRKATKLIITLESDGEVIGRRTLELKICACPGRDFTNDEKLKSSKKKCDPDESPPEKCKVDKHKSDFSSHVSDVSHLMDEVSNAKSRKYKVSPERDSPYVIRLNSKKELDFLMGCSELYKQGEARSSQQDEDSSHDS